MLDETRIPSRYKTGVGDRSVPLGLALAALLLMPAVWVVSGNYLWPWGFAILIGLGLMLWAALYRSSRALLSVRWVEASETLEFCYGKRVKTCALGALTRVEVQPSSVRTRLTAGRQRWVLSHRLVRIDALLDLIRHRRADLFPAPGDRESFSVSAVGLVFLALLAAGTGGAGWLLGGWQPWLGWVFGGGAVLVVIRALWFVPRSFEISPGTLTVWYFLRKTARGIPSAIREESYAAAGALFHRMRLDYGARPIVIDEGHLKSPLRSRVAWIVQQLSASPSQETLAFSPPETILE